MRKFLVAVLATLFTCSLAHGAQPGGPSESEVRDAVAKALPLLQKGALGHRENRSCFACHSQGVPILALTTAQSRGFAIDAKELHVQLQFINDFLHKNRDKYLMGRGQGGQVDTAGYALWTLQAGSWKPNPTTDAVAEYFLVYQKNQEHWRAVSNRPPSEVSPFTSTYLGIRALQAFGTPDQKERIAKRIEEVKGWLLKTPAKDTEDRVFRLWAMQRAGCDAKQVEAAAQELIKTQQDDGGWTQLESMKPDAYATGSALVALQQTGSLATNDSTYERGVDFLLKSQLEDGSWHVRSRSKPFQIYFETGFPHGKDQFISSAASAWAAQALTLALPVATTAPAAVAGDAPARLPRDKLLLYRGPDGKPLPVKSVEDWAKRRAEIVRGMETVMGKLPGEAKRGALDMKVEEEVEGDTYVRRLVTYASEPGGRVPAYLLIPKDVLAGKRKAAAVLCLHGTDNVIGHGTVVGLGKVNRGYALELAQRGYVTLAPNYPLLAKYQPDLKQFGWESGTLKAVWDNMRGLDLLASLPFVDSSKGFGTIGHSLGGHNSVYTAVFDDRLKAVVSSCGLDSYLDYYDGNPKNWDPEKGWCQTRYMLKLAQYKGRLADIPFDFHEMIGALAPRHALIIAPTKDSNFKADSVDRVALAARPVFQLFGHEKRLQVEHPDCAHDFPPEMRELGYKLFDAVLTGK